ncbi:MAG TPA: 3-deoxy-7-phosphoheptulonate synthase class II [Candidatus Hydrogenedentes bacterium]|nr:3-deoxy-7-phosphoheptulonate synthase class II [Candidatus Hydrogenedentota bacterium]
MNDSVSSVNSRGQSVSWSPDSWRAKEALQQPEYDDAEAVAAALHTLRNRPPLVAPGEIERLRQALAEAAEGRRFVLHGGDCAERFTDCTGAALKTKLKVLLQMSVVLTYGTRKPIVRIGRMAGQYAKPRSQGLEHVGHLEVPVYRGDLINGIEPNAESRKPDPQRMLEGYNHAAASLNYIRALIEGGFADLHYPRQWDLAFIDSSPHREAYHQAVDAIIDAIAFMESIGAAGMTHYLQRVDFYTSHEALLLPYEECLTRAHDDGRVYNLGAHFLWAGYRTAAVDGAHIEYLRGIRNPIGVKVGIHTGGEDLVHLLHALDPRCEPGRVTLITRFGERHVAEHLPRLVRAVAGGRHSVVWSCDPMHGNTETARDGRKTRRIDAVFSELEQTFDLHAGMGTSLGGVHFELTGDPVTECIGGSAGVAESDLDRCYETACDPRLNGAQALELAFLIARLLR